MSGTPRLHDFIRVGLLLSLCAVPLAAAQSSSDLPTCGQTCIANEIALASSLGCSTGDNICLCKNQSFGDGIRDCAEGTCPTTADVDATIAYANTYCGPIRSGSSLIVSSSHATTTSKSSTTTSSMIATTRSPTPSSPSPHSASASISSPTEPTATTYTTYTTPVIITFTSTGSLITATYQSTSFITNLAQYLSLESSQTNMVATTLSSAAAPPSTSVPATPASASSSSAMAAAATAPAKNSNRGGGGLSASAKVGIGVGVGVVATAVIFGLVLFLWILRRSGRTLGSEIEGDTSSEGKERSVVGSGGAHSYNYKTGYDPEANLGRGEEAGVGGGGDVAGQNGEVGSGERGHEMTGAQGQREYHSAEPQKSDLAPDQRFKGVGTG